ncbi:hypothetical protein [Deinococcus yavapaiensis]|uniref:Uncharacterized protein n=1 Tax=Deinococcus yavapaiensis KR-236 TaxID=694435 RepID=A0A318S3A3_9DEIO|nr:hypothetical protein [Deinococcus yavapaiensis]PYE52981.1 hypothetical protein DES52_111154 [Deinococcus yavapaiensis KR-236]
MKTRPTRPTLTVDVWSRTIDDRHFARVRCVNDMYVGRLTVHDVHTERVLAAAHVPLSRHALSGADPDDARDWTTWAQDVVARRRGARGNA